jgi:predicted nucleotidyltransferase
MSTEKEVKRFLDTFTQWASGQEEVQALALVGSYARNAAKETSDIDLVMIVREPDRYLHNLKWIEDFGNVEKYQIEDYGLLISVRVWYADGREVEYGLTDERWAAVPLDAGSRRVIEDGMQVLFERRPILSRHK